MPISFADVELDVVRRELRRGGVPVAVEPQVLDLLIYLIENRQRVVTRTELLDAIWKDRVISESTFTSRVNAVRKAVGDSGERQAVIRTIARKGLRFVGEVQVIADIESTPQKLAPAALTLPDKPSVVVLPFQSIGGAPEQDYVADGIVESITAALSRIREFFVIARNSAFVYKGRAVNVCEVGRELGVAYAVEGSVQRGGSRVRVTVQLVETGGCAHLWAEYYDGQMDDIFDLQDRIAERVAGALQPSIRHAEIFRVQRKRPQELGAYDYTMRAMSLVWLLEKESAARGLDLLGKALDIDADYPLALALAAWCWAQSAVYTWVDDTTVAIAKALQLADRAARQATDEPLILAVLGAVHTFARNFGVARIMLERAIALDPNSAWALSRMGWLDVYSDRPDAARTWFEKSIRLSPLDPMNFNNYVGLASVSQVVGDDNAAADLFLRALAERPTAYWIHRNLAPALHAAGRLDEARASLAKVLTIYPTLTITQYKHAMVFSPAVLERIAVHLRALGVPE